VESLLTLQGCRCVSLGTQTPVRDIAWAFSPRYWHWLQAGWVTPPAK